MKKMLEAILELAKTDAKFAEALAGFETDRDATVAVLKENLDEEFHAGLDSILESEEDTASFAGFLTEAAKVEEKDEDDDDKSDDEDESDDDDDKKKETKVKSKAEAVDFSRIREALEDAGVSGDKLSEFSAVVKAVVTEAAKSYAEQAIATLEEENAAKLADIKKEHEAALAELETEMSAKLEAYGAKAVQRFLEDNEEAIAASKEVDKYRKFVEGAQALMADFEITSDDAKSKVVEALEADLTDKKEALDSVTDELLAVKNENLLLKVEASKTELGATLTSKQRERFFTMLEDLDFETHGEFVRRAEGVRDKFFITEAEENDDASKITEALENIELGGDKDDKAPVVENADLTSLIGSVLEGE